jgi:hypothetical protein
MAHNGGDASVHAHFAATFRRHIGMFGTSESSPPAEGAGHDERRKA